MADDARSLKPLLAKLLATSLSRMNARPAKFAFS